MISTTITINTVYVYPEYAQLTSHIKDNTLKRKLTTYLFQPLIRSNEANGFAW